MVVYPTQSRSTEEGIPIANRFFQQFQGSLQKKVVTLYAKVTFNASGVATVVTSETLLAASNPTTINPSSGFVGGTITASGGGEYVFALQDPYVRLLGVTSTVVGGNATDAIALSAVVTTDSVNSQTDPKLGLTFVVLDTGGGPPLVNLGAPLPDDCTILLSVTLSNTTAP